MARPIEKENITEIRNLIRNVTGFEVIFLLKLYKIIFFCMVHLKNIAISEFRVKKL